MAQLYYRFKENQSFKRKLGLVFWKERRRTGEGVRNRGARRRGGGGEERTAAEMGGFMPSGYAGEGEGGSGGLHGGASRRRGRRKGSEKQGSLGCLRSVLGGAITARRELWAAEFGVQGGDGGRWW